MMESHAEKSGERRVLVVLEGIEPTQKAAADVARRINTLCDNFQVTILTSASDRCRKLFPKARVMRLPSLPIRAGSLVFMLWCWLLVPLLRADMVFVAGVINCPSVLTNFGKPILCYGNSHPAQHETTARLKRRPLSRIIGRLYGLTITIGVRKSTLILAISPQLAAVYERLGMGSERIIVSEIGVPLDMFAPPTRARSGGGIYTGVYHGTVARDRGLSIIVEGARLLGLKRKDFRIRLIGCDMNESELVKTTMKNAGLEEIVEIVPPIPHSEIPKELWSADWGISLLEPNVYFESSPPAKVFEYLAAGLPVIANDIQTHTDYLSDGINSLIVPYEAGAFADAMLRLIENPDLRKSLSENALRSASNLSDSGALSTMVKAATLLVERRSIPPGITKVTSR
jgi:glycosyltransferase involved in cell wall biosynthesis